jgi:hypothetical protein
MVATEAAMLMPEHLPIWGRSHDAYDPVDTVREDDAFRVRSAARQDSERTCQVVIDARFGVATEFTSPTLTVELLDQAAVVL